MSDQIRSEHGIWQKGSKAAVITGMRAGAVLLLLLAVSCGGSTQAAPSPTPEVSPPFAQIVSASKATEYKVTYQFTATSEGKGLIGMESWYFKQGKARFDLKVTVPGQSSNMSLFTLPDGAFMCLGTGVLPECTSISSLETAMPQNPVAFYQAYLTAHPERFSAIPVGTRHIAEQHAYCYEVHPVAGSSGLPDGRFCFTAQGIPLVVRVGAQPGQWSMEATGLSTTVSDSDFTLPALPTATIVGRP